MLLAASLAAIAALACTTIARPIQLRQSALLPWQLTELFSFSPSGRPGNYPWSFIKASLTDPNTLTLGTSPSDNSTVMLPSGAQALNCEAKWLLGESPFGRSWPCDNSGKVDGYWSMKIVETDSFSVANFDVVVTRVAEVAYLGMRFGKRFEAEAHFEAGVNLGGSCGGSGVCSWGLREELNPLTLQQLEVNEGSS